jgi:hypothetical protein
VSKALYFSGSFVINCLYKFFPARAEFFDNFLIRASSKFSLNDPFEATPSSNFWADLCIQLKYERFGKTREEIIQYLNSQEERSPWAELGISLYREKGIVSLTETKNNLLMWSHYAQNHTGMVVEFDTTHDFFTSKFSTENNDSVGKINRVLYRKERLDKLGEQLMEPYFHKSDEWSYEKEHRLLLCIYSADIYLLPKSFEAKFVNNNNVKKEKLSPFSDALYKVDKPIFSNIMQEPECMPMYRVPSEAIISVTFGCRSAFEFIDAVKFKLKENNMTNVKLFISTIDKADYRLRFTETKI